MLQPRLMIDAGRFSRYGLTSCHRFAVILQLIHRLFRDIRERGLIEQRIWV
jgi:hypothetical protein